MTLSVPAERLKPRLAVTNAENNYDYAGQDPINDYDLDGTVRSRAEGEGGIPAEPVRTAGGGVEAVVDTEFGFTNVRQISRMGQRLYDSGASSLQRTIRSAEASIQEHIEKIRLAIRTGENIRPGAPETAVINDWYGEIVTREKEIAAAKFVLKYGAVF